MRKLSFSFAACVNLLSSGDSYLLDTFKFLSVAEEKMTSSVDKNCTFLISNDKFSGVQQEEICKDLESSDITVKTRYDAGCI